MRTYRGALALDGVHGARDGGREADAVLGIPHIVVHGFRHGDHLHSVPVELRRVAERVVSADGDQIVQPERLDVP